LKLIESKTLASATASIEFTSIPQTFTDLLAWISLRDTATGNAFYTTISINGSTASFNGNQLIGNSSVAAWGTQLRIAGIHSGNSTTANTFSSSSLYIPNYTGSTNKSYLGESVSENNSASSDSAYQILNVGVRANTDAITSLTFGTNGTSLAIGSTISLYGILKGTDGIVTTSP